MILSFCSSGALVPRSVRTRTRRTGLAAIAVSGLIGYGLDRLFHTRRVFFLIMLGVGVVAGMYNLIRELRKMDDD